MQQISAFSSCVPAAVRFTSWFRPAPSAPQEKAEAVRRKQMKHVLFTTPEVVEVSNGVARALLVGSTGGLLVGWHCRGRQTAYVCLLLPRRLCDWHRSSSSCLLMLHCTQRHSTFTHASPQAGEEVTVYYNPNNSALPGRNQIWIKCALRGS